MLINKDKLLDRGMAIKALIAGAVFFIAGQLVIGLSVSFGAIGNILIVLGGIVLIAGLGLLIFQVIKGNNRPI